MADLKAGSTVGGNPIWHAGTFPLVPAGNSLTYRGKKVYTEIDKPQADDNDFVSKARGGEYAKNVHFVEGLSLNARGGSAEFIPGPGDGADYTTVNAKIQTWYGLGFGSSYGTEGVTIVFNLRNGDIKTKGNISVASGKFVIAGQAPTDNAHLTNKKYVDDRINTVSNVANAAVRKAGDTMTGVLRAEAGVVIVNKATSGEYAPRLDQVISRGVTIDFGTY
ncbi:long-tail fiber protein [Klebsiella phage KP01]|nr:hinge connector of long tail fiber, distal connector [Klebsiella phage KpnM6E1]WFG79262.1 hinge connector of long tail fiber protein distal connector [Klebsiella phage vB_VIPKPNUMC01]